MKTQPKIEFQNSFKTEEEANKNAAQVIGGGIVQKQGGEWLVFAVAPERKLSDWIFSRLEKSLECDRDRHQELLKLAKSEKAKGN